MLVLSRKTGEKIIIAGGITVTVLETSGSRVRLGIEAPPEVSIRRNEINLQQRLSPEASAQPSWVSPLVDLENDCDTPAGSLFSKHRSTT
jgi:carbon storage regulator